MEKTWKHKELTATITLLLGGALFLSPFVTGYFPNLTASWNAWLSGIAILALATAAKQSLSDWPEWMMAAAGIWVILSPWVIGFSSQVDAKITHILTGIGIAVIAAMRLWILHRQSSPKVTA